MLLETMEENTRKMSKRVEKSPGPSPLTSFLTQSSLTLSLKKKSEENERVLNVFLLKHVMNLQRIHALL